MSGKFSSHLSANFIDNKVYQLPIPTRSSPPKGKEKALTEVSAFWCDQGDLNPHGCPYAPQTYASACSAMIAQNNVYNIGLPVFCQALIEDFLKNIKIIKNKLYH